MAAQGAPLRKRVLQWGNSYGIRLTAGDLEELGVAADDEVDVQVRPQTPKLDWSEIADVGWGPNASEQIDERLYRGFLDEHKRNRA